MAMELLTLAVCKSTLTDGLTGKPDGAVAAAGDAVEPVVESADVSLTGDADDGVSVAAVDAGAEVSEVLSTGATDCVESGGAA